jgi:lysophospholipase L1-like esterase
MPGSDRRYSARLAALLLAIPVVIWTPESVGAANAAAGASNADWVGAWAQAPQPAMPGGQASFDHQSIRLIERVSCGGGRWRIHVSNLYGDAPLLIGAAHVARRTAGGAIDPNTDRLLSFAGETTFTIPARAEALSDPIDLEVPALSDLAVSLYLPQPTVASTTHILAMQTSYVSQDPGDSTAAAEMPNAKAIHSRPFLAGIDVVAPAGGATIVVFGDSGVDGDGSSADANRRWTDALAARLKASGGTRLGVLNEGIIGNRLLRDSPGKSAAQFGAALGPSGLARFDRDVLSRPGVKYVLIRLGINDIAMPGSLADDAERATAADLIAGYRQLLGMARQHGLQVIVTTLTPFERAEFAPGFYTPRKDQVRQAVNAWIRSSGEFDAVVDLDLVLRDPHHPRRLAPQVDSGDHLHLNDRGYTRAAEAVPLSLFRL